MGFTILKDILEDWERFELDDSIYAEQGAELRPDSRVNVLSFDPERKRVYHGQAYLLGIEQVRDVITGLDKQLGRRSTVDERVRAVVYYAKNDAFIDPDDL